MTGRLPLAKYPGLSRFALDVTNRVESAMRFLRVDAEGRLAAGDRAALADALVASNAAWGNDVSEAVNGWLQGARPIIAGQQTGLAGGPLYTATKIASVLALRESMRARGEQAVAFFWMATEDHDFFEAARVSLDTHRTHRVIAPTDRPDPRHIVGTLPVPDASRLELIDLFPDLPRDWLREGITFGESFARLLVHAFKGRGLVLVDSLLPELRAYGAPLLRAVVDDWEGIIDSVSARNTALQRAGYAPQIDDVHEHALLWIIDSGGLRHPVRMVDGTLRSEDGRFVRDDIMTRLRDNAASVSTGALARPLLQDFVFPDGVFVGGPAEVSYYAQCIAAHQRLGVPVPSVVLRGHALVVPRRIIERFEMKGFALEELFEEPDRVLARRESDSIARWKSSMNEIAGRIDIDVSEAAAEFHANQSMQRSIDRSSRRIRWHIDRLRDRGARAIARADRERTDAYERARTVLAPDGVPQDRISGWLPWFDLWRERFVDALVDSVRAGSDAVVFVSPGDDGKDADVRD